jgi:hypothetical protein
MRNTQIAEEILIRIFVAFWHTTRRRFRRCIKQQPRNLKWPTIADQLNKAGPYLMGIGTCAAQCWPYSLSDDDDRVPYKDEVHPPETKEPKVFD